MNYKGVEGIKSKNGRLYVSNPYLLEEIKKSKAQDQLTDNAIKMLHLMAENITKKKHYKCAEDKEDCIQTAMMDIVMYWRGFDPDKYSNPFAYYTSLLVNGLSKGWNKIYGKFKASDLASIDTNIFHF